PPTWAPPFSHEIRQKLLHFSHLSTLLPGLTCSWLFYGPVAFPLFNSNKARETVKLWPACFIFYWNANQFCSTFAGNTTSPPPCRPAPCILLKGINNPACDGRRQVASAVTLTLF